MYENSDKFVLNRKSRFSHFEVCCSYTFIKKPERRAPQSKCDTFFYGNKDIYGIEEK